MRRSSRINSAVTAGTFAALVLAIAPGPGLAAPASAAPAPSVATAPAVSAKAATHVWSPVKSQLRASDDGHRRAINPRAYKAFTLDSDGIATQLDRAPDESAGRAGMTISVPAPDGELVAFRVVQTEVMEAGLAAAHPEITTYAGKAVKSNAEIVIDQSPYGFHAAVRGSGASWYVDPAYVADDSLYLSYIGTDLPAPEKPLVEPELDTKTTDAIKGGSKIASRLGEGPDQQVVRRTYRLALVTDPTYAEYNAPGSNAGTITDDQSNSMVLAAKVTLMNRVNQIYTNDLAVRMVLVNGEDKLNFNTVAKATGANGPCGLTACYTAAQLSTCAGGTLTRNRYVAGLLIGADNFDIGHIGLGVNGGGIASLGVVGAGAKAQGCTGLPQPIGDFYAIDYVAHEMGHEFSGNHTFNGTKVNCSTSNRNAGTSVEPGSGTSVMAYAGICASDDLQPHTDPYFSQRSQQEITTYLTRTLAAISENQAGALTGFTTDGYSFTLTFPGKGTTVPIVRGTAAAGQQPYTAAGIKAAIEAVLGGTVSAFGPYGTGTPTDGGYTIGYSGALAGVDVPNPTLNVVNGAFTGYDSDIVKGGLPTNNGIQDTPNTNHAPNVTAPASKTIPVQTPFALTGSATDLDNDSLVYLWEQNDVGAAGTANGTGLTTQPKANGPLFRVFGKYADVSAAGTLQYQSPGENLATTSPTRTFPDMDQILAGTTNQATGSCPTPTAADTKSGVADTALKPGGILDCFSEFLPTASYVGTAAATNTEPSLNFRLTARDQNPVAGGYQFAQTKLLLDRTAGPLYVTSIATAGTTLQAGQTHTVTWNVNNTDKATLAPNVKISLSTDGGQTYPTVLDASTANDGSDDVTVPNVSTSTARIKVEAVDNYFFDVNHANFSINYPPAAVTNVVAQAGDSRVHLDFTTPTGTPAPTGYIVTQTTGDNVGSTTTLGANATSADITGLTNGTDYAFTVVAVNGPSASTGVVSNTVTPRVVAGEYVGLNPTRILDTRKDAGRTALTDGDPIAGGRRSAVTVPVAGLGGVPASGVTAVVLNLAGVNASQDTYISALTSPSDPVYTSNLNFTDRAPKAVQVTVPVAPDGTITLFNSAGTIDVIVDVEGYFQDGSGLEAGRMHPQRPQRLLDTRSGQGTDDSSPARIGDGKFIDVQVTGNAGVPAGSTAVVVNLVGVNPTTATYLRAYAANGPQPYTSTLNLRAGEIIGNLATVPLSASGKMRIFNASGAIDVVADVMGYVSPASDATGGRYVAASERVLDTRSGPRLGDGQSIDTGVDAPSAATGVLFGLTSINPTRGTYLTVKPAGSGPAYTANLNTEARQIVNNAVLTAVGTSDTTTRGITITNASGEVDVIVDVQGYFVP